MKQATLAQPLVFFILALTGCMATDDAADVSRRRGPTTVSSDFESGNIGAVQKLGEIEWVLSLPDDNDNAALPDNWRTWWYVRFDDVRTDAAMTITVDNNVWPYYYVPVYSYDRKLWHRFEDSEVTQPDPGSTRMVKRFTRPTVWIARFYPYTFTDLNGYLARLGHSRKLTRETVGTTTLGAPMEVLTITDPRTPDSGKRRIWLHARSHPAETGSSFLLEGLIDFLLCDDPDARTSRSSFVYSILPMHNIDGVVVGNYRTTPGSENLENLWLRDPADPWRLTPAAPHEVHVLRDAIVATLEAPDAIPVTVAINLHSSNSEPDTAPFFFPHFGPEALGYAADQAALWTQQIALTDAVEGFYGPGLIEPRPIEGGGSFVNNNFPESWWWHNRGAEVNAITLETVYGRAGFAPRWVTPADLRALGRALGLALLAYHGLPVSAVSAVSAVSTVSQPRSELPRAAALLSYPELYPPAMESQIRAE